MRLEIRPYRLDEVWAFDHEHLNTKSEALMNGTEKVIDYYFRTLHGRVPLPGDQMSFQIDTRPFEGAITALDFVSTDEFGTFYVDRLTDMTVWLCPWLQGYFGKVPPILYVNPGP